MGVPFSLIFIFFCDSFPSFHCLFFPPGRRSCCRPFLTFANRAWPCWVFINPGTIHEGLKGVTGEYCPAIPCHCNELHTMALTVDGLPMDGWFLHGWFICVWFSCGWFLHGILTTREEGGSEEPPRRCSQAAQGTPGQGSRQKRGFGEKTLRGATGVLLSRNGCSVTIDTRKEKHPTATAKSSKRI